MIEASPALEVAEDVPDFTGRTRLLSDLCIWLAEAPTGVRMITGPPGSGKSAILARLTRLSDPFSRERMRREGRLAGVPRETIPQQGVIDCAIDARGTTADDCALALARALDVPLHRDSKLRVRSDLLMEAVSGMPRRVTVVIDAVDQALHGQAQRIADELILPLGRLPNVKLLLGLRRDPTGSSPDDQYLDGLFEAFGGNAMVDQLEAETGTAEDIMGWAKRWLAANSEHPAEFIAAAAETVAESAGSSFLHARVVSRSLAASKKPRLALPRRLGAAFTSDVDLRLGPEAQRAHRCLAALAWSLGKGLSLASWPVIANALATDAEPLAVDDIRWALEKAGPYVSSRIEGSQTVYRLSHQQLEDHYRRQTLRSGLTGPEAHRRIFRALIDGIASGVDGRGWLDCDPYTRRYLADHAALAGGLDDLARQPGFLSAADPLSLVRNLDLLETDQAREMAAVYMRASRMMMNSSPAERLAYLHLTAKTDFLELASRFEPAEQSPWTCSWVHVKSSDPVRVVGQLEGPILAMAIGITEREMVAVSGGEDRTVRICSLSDGATRPAVLEGHRDWVRAVAVGEIDGEPVAVSAGEDKTILRWNTRTGTLIGSPLLGHERPVGALAVGTIDGVPVIVSGGDDSTVRVWTARSGTLLCNPLRGHRGWILCLALGNVDSQPVIVSGSRDETARLWDARTGAPIGPPLRGHDGWVTAVAVGRVGNRPVVVTGSDDLTIRVWDARDGEQICDPIRGHARPITTVAIGEIDGRVVIVSGSEDKTVRIFDAVTGSAIRPPMTAHERPVISVAITSIGDEPIVVSASADGTIRTWNLAADEARAEQHESHEPWANTVAIGTLDGQPVIVSATRDNTLKVRTARTGAALGKALRGHTDIVTAVEVGDVDGQPVVVSASRDRTVRMWDARKGVALSAPIAGHDHWVSAVTFGWMDGRQVVVTGSWDKTIRIWDARTASPIGSVLHGHERAITALDMGGVSGQPLIVSGSQDETARIWDARSGAAFGAPLADHEGSVVAVAIGSADGKPVVATGTSGGTLRTWDVRTGASCSGPVRVSSSSITAVAFGQVGDRALIACATQDGTFQVYDTCSLALELEIDIASPIRSLQLCGGGEVILESERGVFALELASGLEPQAGAGRALSIQDARGLAIPRKYSWFSRLFGQGRSPTLP